MTLSFADSPKSGIKALVAFMLATQQGSLQSDVHVHGVRGHLVQHQQVFWQV